MFTNRFEINNLKFQYFKYLYMNNSIFNTKSAQKEKVEAYQNILNEQDVNNRFESDLQKANWDDAYN